MQIDIKPNNDPDRLFRLIKETVQKFPDYGEELAPRLMLGLWHPKFLLPAKKYVPTLFRLHIGASVSDARNYFWDDCDAFSMCFPILVNGEGQKFLQEARAAKKDVMVWTVNRIDEMVEATRWGVKAILTDRTDVLQSLRKEMQQDFVATEKKYVSPFFRWTNFRYYTPTAWAYGHFCSQKVIERAGITYQAAAEANRSSIASTA
ncbi:hypothetical protein MYAM1_001640 [Malassezia yamatoensis]|uniref:GP-PDE domain-containing protein n=1 Tax=Malassezia yamatoensis TaxID=253288 RepID=A0AAJ6CG23_9BASI|nr:hypothetical protein MYAM1_001640 [Malassezia yamatoensis]